MRADRARPAILLAIALLAGLIVLVAGCQNKGSIHPFEPTPLPGAFLQSFSVYPTTLGLGDREAEMTAYVVDAEGEPVEGAVIRFTTDLGTVSDSAVSDSLGVAKAIFRSGSTKGTAKVVASIGSVQFEASILIGANELIVGQTTALADGRTVIPVSASVYRPDGSSAQRVFITFSATAGTIPATALSDSSGWVSVELTAPASEADIQAEITASVEGSEIDPTGAFGIPPDEQQVVGVALIQFRGITLALSSEKSELVASGSDSTDVYCLVSETVSKVPVPGLEVYFGTDLGSIKSPITTDGSGVAVSRLFSDIFPGTAAVGASVETLTDSTKIEFTPLSLEPLKATPREILTGGDQALLTTRLLNQSNNPVEGMTIHFETDLGVIPGEAITDTMGQVAVHLASGDSTGTAFVSARFGSLLVSTEVSFRDPVIEPIRLTDIWWEGQPLSDGESGTWVSTRLLNEGNNPVIGSVVEFATDLGVIAEVDTTDSSGVASAWLTAILSPDTILANVTASHGSLSVSATIPFVPPASRTPVAMMLKPAVNDIQVAGASGLESVVLSAVAFDASGDTVFAGSDVTFRIVDGPGGGEFLVWPDSGSGSEITVPIVNGAARISLNAGTVSGIVALEAETGDHVTATAAVTITAGPPMYATVGFDSVVSTASGGGLYAWKVGILVTDVYSNPVSEGTPVFVTLHADSCGSVDAPDGLSISGSAYTGNVPSCQALLPEPGIAYVCIISPYINFEEFPSFAIEARSGSNDLLGCLEIRHGATTSEPATVELIAVEDTSLSVQGVGGNETSLLEWEVRDAQGFPLGSSNAVDVDFSIVASPGGGVTLSPMSSRTNNVGRVYTTVSSGTVAGVVRIRASAGDVQSSAASVAIHGGPPDADHFSIAPASMNVAGLLHLGIENRITAYVYDQYANPVPEGTAIYFTTDFGGILGSALTGFNGQGHVDLYSALPLPDCGGGGLVTVTARTIDGANQTIETQTSVLFTGSTVITSDVNSFAVPDSGFQDIFFTVSDQCGNPLVHSSKIDITSSGGILVGAVSTLLPDTRDVAWTRFWVRLSDDQPGDVDPPMGHSIEVEVSSSNGSGNFILFGTID